MPDIAPIRRSEKPRRLNGRESSGRRPTFRRPSSAADGDGSEQNARRRLRAWQKAGLVTDAAGLPTVADSATDAGTTRPQP